MGSEKRRLRRRSQGEMLRRARGILRKPKKARILKRKGWLVTSKTV
jgi:hypothetical protein